MSVAVNCHPAFRTARITALLVAAVGLAGSTIAPAATAATAATATTTTRATQKPAKAPTGKQASSDVNYSPFCSQVTTSQSAIGATKSTSAAKNGVIAVEWGKIETKAPAPLKADVTKVRAAFAKASKETDAAAKVTLGAIGTPSKNIADFVAKNCRSTPGRGPGGGGDGPRQGRDPAQTAALRDCMKKAGFEIPEPGNGGAQPNFEDPKFQAAAQKCGFGGRGGGTGQRGLSDAVRACVEKKGVTLPTRPAQGQAGNQQRGGAARAPFDAKTQAAIEACRAANPT